MGHGGTEWEPSEHANCQGPWAQRENLQRENRSVRLGETRHQNSGAVGAAVEEEPCFLCLGSAPQGKWPNLSVFWCLSLPYSVPP